MLTGTDSIDESETAGFRSLPPPRQARSNSIIQLNGDDEGNAPVCVEKAEQRAEGVEALGDQDAVLNGGVDFAGEIRFQELFFDSTGPTQVKDDTEKEDVEPVDHERGAITGELGKKRGGKRNEGHHAEEGDVNPGEASIGTFQIVELRLLSDPEDSQGEDAHGEHQQARSQRQKSPAEIVLSMDRFGKGDFEVEDEQGHRYGKDAVAERGDALDTLSGDLIVGGLHERQDFTWRRAKQ